MPGYMPAVILMIGLSLIIFALKRVFSKKAPSAHQLPCPSILRGGGFLFAVLCFIMEL